MANQIKIGGTKGHIEEIVHNDIFIAIYTSFRWKMIPECTGRYTCRDHNAVSQLTPNELLRACGVDKGVVDSLIEYKVDFDKSREKDPILVIPFSSCQTTGLISYVKLNDCEKTCSYVHTLNSRSGFKRKLDALDIVLRDSYILHK